MARGNDRKDKQERRAREELDKGLRRGDAELTLGAFVELGASDAAAFASKAGALVGPAIETARRAGQWPKLAQLAAKADKAPAVIDASPEPAESWWALFWASVRQRDMARAIRLFERLRVPLADAPLLLAASEAMIDQDAELPDGLIIRLGRTMSEPASKIAPPVYAEDVEPAVLALCGARPWHEVAETLERWMKQMAGTDAERVLSLATRLSAQALLVAVSEPDVSHESSVPVVLLAARSMASAPSIEPALFAVFKALLIEARRPAPRHALISALPPLALALATQPVQTELIIQAIETLPPGLWPARETLSFFERMLPKAPSPMVWALAAESWCRVEEAQPEFVHAPSARNLEAMISMLGASPITPSLLSRLSAEAADRALMLFGRLAPPTLVERSFEMCFEHASERQRRSLATMVVGLSARAGTALAELMSRQFGHSDLLPPEMRLMMNQLAAARVPAADEAERILRRLAPRAAHYDQELFEVVAATELDDVALTSLVWSFVDASEGLRNYMVAYRVLDARLAGPLATQVMARGIARFAGDLDALATGMIEAMSTRAPLAVSELVAKALIDAAAENPPTSISPELSTALQVAGQIVPQLAIRAAERLGALDAEVLEAVTAAAGNTFSESIEVSAASISKAAVPTAAVVEEAPAEEPKSKPKRTRKPKATASAEGEVPVAASVSIPEAAPEPARRTRTKKAKPAEAAPAAAETIEVPAAAPSEPAAAIAEAPVAAPSEPVVASSEPVVSIPELPAAAPSEPVVALPIEPAAFGDAMLSEELGGELSPESPKRPARVKKAKPQEQQLSLWMFDATPQLSSAQVADEEDEDGEEQEQ